MNTVTKQKVTLMLDTEVYDGLRKKVGVRGIGAYLSKLARPFAVQHDLRAGYKALAHDAVRQAEAAEWIEGVQDGVAGENVWDE